MQAPFKPLLGILILSLLILSCSNLSSNPDGANHLSALSTDENETPEDSEPSDTGDTEEPTETGDGTLETTDADGGTVEVTEAVVVVDRIRLLTEEEEPADAEEPEEGEIEEGEETPEEIEAAADESADEEAEVEEEVTEALQVEGPFMFDLVAMTTDPLLADEDFVAGTYDRVDVRIHSLNKNSEDELAGFALKVVGTCTLDETVQDFILFAKLNEWLHHTAEGGVVITGAADILDILKELILVDWFQNINLCTCLMSDRVAEDDGGVITVVSPGNGGACNFTSDLKQTTKGTGEPTP